MWILSRADVQRVLTMPMAIEACRQAYIAVSDGLATVPQRHAVHVPQRDGDMLVMSGYLPGLPALGLKVISTFTRNHEHGLASTLGAILLLDPATAVPQVLMDGGLLTAVRTGAGSGVATDLLARQDADSVAILGTGGMAWDQLQAVATVRPIRQVFVWNRTRARAEDFAQKIRATHIHWDIQVFADPDEALARASIVCAATSSPDPVVHGSALQAGTHVNLTGAHRPDWREVDSAAVKRAGVLCVDSATAGLYPGDFSLPLKAGEITRAEIVEIGAISTAKATGRTHADEITLFKSVGLAAQDLAVAVQVHQAARQLGLGTHVDLIG